MKENIFFNEYLYLYLLKHDSYFNKYITNSIKDYSYIYSKNLMMEVKLDINYDIYIKFVKYKKHKNTSSIEKYFKLVDEFLKNEEFINSHFLFYENTLFKISKNKITRNNDLKFVNNEKIKIVKKEMKNILYKSSSLIKILKEIYKDINFHSNQNIRIVVESKDDFLILIDYIVKNNLNIKIKEYKYLYEFDGYFKLIKYLEKNEYHKEKLIKILKINTSDYYSYSFNEFLINLINIFNSKEQFLFYLYFYKDLYFIKKDNLTSNVSLELFSELSLNDGFNYLILNASNTFKDKEEATYYLRRTNFIISNVKVYLRNNKIENNHKINILRIINDDKK